MMNVLHCLGVGTVAINKETDTDIIQVKLPKEFPSQDGETVATAEEVSSSYNTQTGDIKQNKVLVGSTVPAKWMPLNTNRITSPDVREGTKVVVYQYINTNRYLWTLEGFDGTLRLETVVYAWSASPDIDENTPITPDNYYMLFISSHKKKIELITGQGNGEACGYQLTLNLDEGYIGMMDSFGQILMNHGVESAFSYINKFKSQFSINKKDFTLTNEGNSVIDTKESIKMHSKNISILADEALNMRAKTGEIVFENGLKMSVGGVYDLVVNSQFNINTPLAAFSQLVTAGKRLSAPSLVGGGTEMVGHKHSGVQSGGSMTGGPIGGASTFSVVYHLTDGDKTPIEL